MRGITIHTIVITGGPCSGKTSAMKYLRARFEQLDIPAIFVEEAGTDLILAGISPTTLGSMLPFQTRVALLQKEREEQAQNAAAALIHARIHESIASKHTTHTALVVCDRGIADGAAYLSPEDYAHVLDTLDLSAKDVYLRYDAVFCLESTATLALEKTAENTLSGHESPYTLQNNNARTETPEEAAALDKRTAHAWEAHPHFYFIANKDSFEAKALALFEAIMAFLDSSTSMQKR